MTLNKLNKAVSYKMRVYEELKSAIINEKLKPGEVLNERKIAEELGISRTPVREVIQMLENEGWVNTEPWKGSYVVNITNQDVEEIFQLRRTLESLVIELIVPKIGELEINKIEELINKQSRYCKEYNAENFIYKDRDFHMYLVHLTNNKRLIEILTNLNDLMINLGVKSCKSHERFFEAIEEHKKILEGLKKHDLKEAEQAMVEHILNTKDKIIL